MNIAQNAVVFYILELHNRMLKMESEETNTEFGRFLPNWTA